jgi:hypothetical protein
MSDQRHCLMCTHCDVELGWAGTSDTPGDAGHITCQKGHWELYPPLAEIRKDLAANMEQATDCADFEEDI